ncbi:putative Late nodulin [Medicago truncatula]|uniref:Putative Late nodulin n=1 Tax=Medicago truncatula TaxID=3880 RepID=A0A396J9Z6_MEDTR|nr:putative Late nodulin [Medicago truncatula]
MHGILAIKTDQIICLFVRCKRKKSMAKTLKFVCVVVILFLFLILVAAEMDELRWSCTEDKHCPMCKSPQFMACIDYKCSCW